MGLVNQCYGNAGRWILVDILVFQILHYLPYPVHLEFWSRTYVDVLRASNLGEIELLAHLGRKFVDVLRTLNQGKIRLLANFKLRLYILVF